jgi:uncharacterized membrane protein YfhO
MVSVERLSVVVRVSTAKCAVDSLLLLRRPWFPGYRARIGAQELRLVVVDLVMPAVVVPPRFEGQISIEYRPRALWLGIKVAVAGLIVLVGVMIVGLVRRFRQNAGDHMAVA